MPPLSPTDIHDDTPAYARVADALTKERSVPRLQALNEILPHLRPAERLALYVLTMILAGSVLAILVFLNAAVSTIVPADGGSLTEGQVGSARFINPVIAISQADQDLTTLVYSGLMRGLPDGTFIPDLAESYEVSADGTTYTFTIRRGATFHDDKPVTADDVAYTIAKTQDPAIKSPHRADWDGVKVETPDVRTIIFTLPHPYAPFLANTTIGVLPKHLWAAVAAADFPFTTLNTKPIGSGPYQVTDLKTDQTGAATRYDLVPFADFTLGRPHLARISFAFFPNQDALLTAFDDGDVDAIAGLPPGALKGLGRDDAKLISMPLPRVFAVFFNQAHQAVLAEPAVRAALDAALDKQLIIDSVLLGKAAMLDGPVPPGIIEHTAARAEPLRGAVASSTRTGDTAQTIARAREILTGGGWSFDEDSGIWTKSGKILAITLSTADAPELIATTNSIATQWRAAGIQVQTAIYPISELNTGILRPRNYDALLFGEVVGREADLFAFWHSSQRMDPGLNLSLYANTRTDTLLSQARMTNDRDERNSLYRTFAGMIANDKPAVFLYAPDFLYVVPEDLRGVALGTLTAPAERFLDVYRWHTETQRVWNVFTGDAAE
ncbi:hypothetical protein FJY94_03115 [Candidatus Kaiserbacteria bacterium]|nr:hypothetical protein [Candidatus Kaiserbacteria bacterium]